MVMFQVITFRFEITPSVLLEVNINTNWTLDIKCLDDTFPCNSVQYSNAVNQEARTY